jgi:hypothetical protein
MWNRLVRLIKGLSTRAWARWRDRGTIILILLFALLATVKPEYTRSV